MAKVPTTSPSPGRKRTRKADGKSTSPKKSRKTAAAEDVAPPAAAAAPAPAPTNWFRWGSGLGGAAASSDPPAPAASRRPAAASSPAAKKTKAAKRSEAEARAAEWANKRKAKKAAAGTAASAPAPAPEESDDDEAAGVSAPAPAAAATTTSAPAPPRKAGSILTRLVTLSFLLFSTLGLAALYSQERSLRILTETNLSQELRTLQAEVEAQKAKLAESEKARLTDARAAADARKCSSDLRRERIEREASAVEFQKQIDACGN